MVLNFGILCFNRKPHKRIRAVAVETNPNLCAGTMYGGVIYKGQASFYGHNSEKRLHRVQNGIYRNIPSKTPYFPDRGLASKPYTCSGSYHSSYLYY